MRRYTLHDARTDEALVHVCPRTPNDLEPWFLAQLSNSSASGVPFEYQLPTGTRPALVKEDSNEGEV